MTGDPIHEDPSGGRRCILHPKMPCPAQTADDTCRCVAPRIPVGQSLLETLDELEWEAGTYE